MTLLFDDIARADSRPARETESTYDFLNRHDSAFFQRVRNLLEDWFSHLPAEERDTWKKSFQSGDDRVSQSAFWELYLHEVFLRMGCVVEIHSEVPETKKKPDFLVRCDGVDFYVEATLLGVSDAELAEERRRDRLYETLQGTKSPDFFLMIDPEWEEGLEDPPGRRIRDELERWISEHAWEELRPVFERNGPAAMPERSFKVAGWRIPVRLLPKSPDLRGDPSVRPVGVFGAVTSVSDPIEDLRRPLREKATRFGVLPHPYLIAVIDPTNPVLDDQDVEGALYGRTVDLFGRDSEGQPVHVRTYRKEDGFWRGPPSPQNTRVSGVVLAPNIRPESIARLEPELWVNAWAARPLAVDMPWRVHAFNPETGEVEQRQAVRSPAELLGMPADWPGPEHPFS